MIIFNSVFRRDKTISELTNQGENDQRTISQLQKKIQELLVGRLYFLELQTVGR